MRYRFIPATFIIIAITGLMSGPATADEYFNNVSWVAAEGKQCASVCRASGGRLPVQAAGKNGTTINVCRAELDVWPTIGYDQNGACVTLKGDRLSPGVVQTSYDCLCGRL
jgi:hypothetical protein